jgi:hypothetical protein
MILGLRAVIFIYGPAVELASEDGLDSFLTRSLLKLCMREYISVFSEGEATHAKLSCPPHVRFGQRISIQETVGGMMMETGKPHLSHAPMYAGSSLVSSDEDWLFSIGTFLLVPIAPAERADT